MKDDEYIGETLLDLDPRTENRRIRVFTKVGDRYRAQVVSNDAVASKVGRTVTVSAKTLDTRYKKVSH